MLTKAFGCGKIFKRVKNGEMSERFKELVLKTSDSKEPRVRIPFSPPFFYAPLIYMAFFSVTIWSSTQVGDEAPLLRV